MKIVFATNNKHKLIEIKDILGNDFNIVSLKDIGCNVDIPETANTLEGNASIKSHYIYNNYHLNCFADDTGLEVDALNLVYILHVTTNIPTTIAKQICANCSVNWAIQRIERRTSEQ